MSKQDDSMERYADMLDLPHHVSKTRPRMPVLDRAAQFSPFAALTGFEDAVRETARLTDMQRELDASQREILDRKLHTLLKHCEDPPEVTITHFIRDKRKAGGAYVKTNGRIRKIDSDGKRIVMENMTGILMDDICEIESALFSP